MIMTRTIKISDEAYKEIEKLPGDSFKEKIDNLLDIENRAMSREEVKELIDKETPSEEELAHIVEQKIKDRGYR